LAFFGAIFSCSTSLLPADFISETAGEGVTCSTAGFPLSYYFSDSLLELLSSSDED
jgi:hypothetical protein